MFIEIAEAHPRFLRKQLVEVVGAMLQASTSPGGRGCGMFMWLLLRAHTARGVAGELTAGI